MNMSSFIFCVLSLVACLAVAALAYPFAIISKAELDQSRALVAAEDLGEVEIRELGKVSVLDIVTNYIDNPPEVKPTDTVGTTHFSGC